MTSRRLVNAALVSLSAGLAKHRVAGSACRTLAGWRARSLARPSAAA